MAEGPFFMADTPFHPDHLRMWEKAVYVDENRRTWLPITLKIENNLQVLFRQQDVPLGDPVPPSQLGPHQLPVMWQLYPGLRYRASDSSFWRIVYHVEASVGFPRDPSGLWHRGNAPGATARPSEPVMSKQCHVLHTLGCFPLCPLSSVSWPQGVGPACLRLVSEPLNQLSPMVLACTKPEHTGASLPVQVPTCRWFSSSDCHSLPAFSESSLAKNSPSIPLPSTTDLLLKRADSGFLPAEAAAEVAATGHLSPRSRPGTRAPTEPPEAEWMKGHTGASLLRAPRRSRTRGRAGPTRGPQHRLRPISGRRLWGSLQGPQRPLPSTGLVAPQC
ncbi:hypothetical protein AB1E18_015822 [Capra hircus]